MQAGDGRNDEALAAGLRALPSVNRLLELWPADGLDGREAVAAALRGALDDARQALREGAAADSSPATLIAEAQARLPAASTPGLRRVINAAGVVVHTNLGRAPLALSAQRAMVEAAGYANLEFDLDSGSRGLRGAAVEAVLRDLTGAEAALAVNNAAAAVLLALSALAGGGEVVVSRGELVEIGGGFRIPDVIAQGGARLVEVGSTNRTRPADYAAAITERTRVLLKVHQSNYRIVGFTAEAGLAELADLARSRGLLLMHDLGGGALGALATPDRVEEPTIAQSLGAGADLVAFSGDKLLGGPQAGLIVGKRAALDPLRRHPLLRAVRLDKTTLAALEATLRLHGDPERARREIPVLRMLAQSRAEVAARAERLRASLHGPSGVEIVETEAFTGGGALPGEARRSVALAVDAPGLSADGLARRLRLGTPAVVGRVHAGRLLLDLYAVSEADVEELAAAVRAAVTATPGGRE